jgi:hypothetical protein
VLEAAFILLEFPSPSRRIFIGSHSLPPLWFAISVLQCPKDPFPLPRIDQVVDSTAGCVTLCFLDAYSEYHQIAMCIADQLATSFITPFGTYYYQTMPFGLKNAGATFQRCMRRVFGELIGHIIEAYVDDIVVNS